MVVVWWVWVGVWVSIWVVGFRADVCDFFRWVRVFVLMGLMVGFGVCEVCLVMGFGEDDDDDDEEELVRRNGFGMNRDSDGRSRGWQRWQRRRLEDCVGGCLDRCLARSALGGWVAVNQLVYLGFRVVGF